MNDIGAKQTIPISWAFMRAAPVLEQGLPQDELFTESFISPSLHSRISFAQLGLLYFNIIKKTEDAFVGLGRRSVSISETILMARIMVGCATLECALNAVIRFHQSSPPLRLELRTNGKHAALCVHCDDSFAGANAFIIEEIYLNSLFGALTYFLGRPFPARSVVTRNPANIFLGMKHYSMLAPVRLGAATALQFPAKLLSEVRSGEPADDIWWQIARQWLAHIVAENEPSIQAGASIEHFSTATMCSELSVSPATLRRRMSNAGTSLRDLRKEAFIDISLRRLGDTSRSVCQIASELGYSDVRSYRRFIKNETGFTPDQLRAQTHFSTMQAAEPQVLARIRQLTTYVSL